ncbi:MAG: triose-phosphate isomerase, partial [Erysipelotrichaceae bacterium]|nr:triose-phosphate isomerase [Erysipelotrichaceae bacterium]
MTKKLFFGSNLKMYKNTADTVAYLKELEKKTKDIPDITMFIIPSFTTLERASQAVDHRNIMIG